MSSEAVKKQLLIAVTALNLPLDGTPSSKRVGEACAAAKLLRNRLLREQTRVQGFIEGLRQKQLYNENSEEEEDNDAAVFGGVGDDNMAKCSRAEFVFLAEMMVVEKLVVPLLLAHGMKFGDTLLPQLLKLLTAMLQPVPRFSANETQQRDLLTRVKQRCGSDEFFALLVQSVAPIAEKRSDGNLQRGDVVLLEVVLSLIALLLDGQSREAEGIIGSFCRNHGIELLLVVINQNYSKTQQRTENENYSRNDQRHTEQEETSETEVVQNTAQERTSHASQIILGSEDIQMDTLPATLVLNDSSTLPQADCVSIGQQERALSASDADGSSSDQVDEEDEELHIHDAAEEIEKQFEQRVLNLLESDEQLWKWNCLAMASIANVFNCVSPVELAQLSLLGQTSLSSPDQLLNLLRGGSHFRECKKETDNWRIIARSRNGAMNSTSVLVRLDPTNRPGTVGGRAIGTVSSLFGTRRKDPLENIKEMDLRKRGRFVKGMFQDSSPRCDLPLPTKIVLSQQSQSFLCFGFEPLNTMVWQRIQAIALNVERTAKEYKETVSGFKNSGERMEITSPLAPELYHDFAKVTQYMSVCGNLLHYIREVARLMKQDNIPYTSQQFQQQWQSVSSIISLDHLEGGFAVLRSFLQCRDLRKRCNILDVVNYLAELLFMLNLILEKEVVNDPAVDVAAHALASSVLYKEESIKTVFDLLNEYANRNLSVPKSQSLTLFVFAVFQLMEHCSYNGHLLLPKKHKRKGNITEAADDGGGDDEDKESVNSALLEAMEREMADQMADMIHDSNSEAPTSESDTDRETNDGDKDDNGEDSRDTHLVATPITENEAEGLAGEHGNSPDSAAGPATRTSGEAAHPRPGENTEEEENDQARAQSLDEEANQTNEGDGHGMRAGSSVRAPSEAHPASVASLASSGRTALSTISSEREVAVGGYWRRLATTKNVGLLYSALRHWRISGADVNLGLTYLMEGLTKAGCESVFFNIGFLLLFRDVLVNGQRTHEPLYDVCDRLVYDFFNPSYARALDFRAHNLFDEGDTNVLAGSQSFLGFEVALRCGRSLFNFASVDYDVLEEKAMPHLMEYTAIPLHEQCPGTGVSESPLFGTPGALQDAESRRDTAPENELLQVTEEMVEGEREQPRRKKRRHRRRDDEEHDEQKDSVKKRRKERKPSGERTEKRRRERQKARGPQGPTEQLGMSEAAAEEEDRMFQALMAAIAPPTSPQEVTAGAGSVAVDDEAALLS